MEVFGFASDFKFRKKRGKVYGNWWFGLSLSTTCAFCTELSPNLVQKAHRVNGSMIGNSIVISNKRDIYLCLYYTFVNIYVMYEIFKSN